MSYDVYRPRRDDRVEASRVNRDGRGGSQWPPPRYTGAGYGEDESHPYGYYRPRSRSRSPGPTRRRAPSPLQAPRRGHDVYRFGDRDREDRDANFGDDRDNFNFRSNEQREFRTDGAAPREPRKHKHNHNHIQRGRGGRNTGRGGTRQPWRPPPGASERKILHANTDREGTPDRLEGMVEGASQFKDVNDLFVSDEDESGDSAMDLEEPNTDAEPSKKRVKTNGTAPLAQEQPQWSNPDPYFIVPPVDESRHQRKDVVQLLRRAKVEAEKAAPSANAVSRNADFIGFGDEEEEGEEELIRPNVAAMNGQVSEDGEINSDELMSGSRVAGDAPLANGHTENSAQPTQQIFSHLRNLHQVPTPQPNPQPNPQPKHPHAVTNEMQAREDSVEIVSERVLNEARDVLAEINAEDKRGAREPQARGRGGRVSQGQKRPRDSDGDITRSWQAKDRDSATPWHVDHSHAPDTVYWLHQEICDFHEFIRPQPFEAAIRNDLIKRLQNICQQRFKGSKVLSFGSFAQGIYLPTSDMDLVLYSADYQKSYRPSFNQKKTLYTIQLELQRAGIIDHVADATVIAGAKVPIIKFVDAATGLNCDMSLDNDSGVRAVATFEKWCKTWPFLPKLLSVLKQWLLMRGVNEVFNGGLGGFSLTCMLVSMLQQRVDGQTGNLSGNVYLGELLLEFLDLYGNKFNMDQVGIDMPTAEYFNKDEWRMGKRDRWTIIDPNKRDNDLSGGSSQARLIQRKFSQSHADLIRTMKTLETAGHVLRKGQSFLRLIIGGDYERVVLQRGIMREVHKKYLGPV